MSPKYYKNAIPIKNVYFMLAYAYGFVDFVKWREVEAEATQDPWDLIAALFEVGVGRLIKQGLQKEYRTQTDALTRPRGRIDIRASLTCSHVSKKELVCEFDELTYDTTFNRIIKTTAKLFIESKGVATVTRNKLRKELFYFSSISTIDPRNIQWNNLRIDRNNRNYRFLLDLCQLAIEGTFFLDKTVDAAGAGKRAPHPTPNENPKSNEDLMPIIFEKFLLGYFQRHYPHLTPKPQWLDWELDNDFRARLPKMKTDITLTGENEIMIIDAKFYGDIFQYIREYKSETIHSDDLYQIFAYVKNTAAHEPQKKVKGMLLYAMTSTPSDLGSPPGRRNQELDFYYSMSGNRIYAKTIDLSQDFDDIEAQLKEIVGLTYKP